MTPSVGSFVTCTRRLEWDAAHRVLRHESKCAHLHGHRYRADVTCEGVLDSVGRVIDFGIVKLHLGTWIDEWWDHGTLVNPEDLDLIDWLEINRQKYYTMHHGEPTAENLAKELLSIARAILEGDGIEVVNIRIYETPNCWADASGDIEVKHIETSILVMP